MSTIIIITPPVKPKLQSTDSDVVSQASPVSIIEDAEAAKQLIDEAIVAGGSVRIVNL